MDGVKLSIASLADDGGAMEARFADASRFAGICRLIDWHVLCCCDLRICYAE